MDPAKMKVVDLRQELGALGLDTKGNKPALVERLRKALEAKSGEAIAETTILDTSAEDAEEPTPRKPGPASRTTRRSSSSRLAGTPAKQARIEEREPIEEDSCEAPEKSSDSGSESDEPLVAPSKPAAPEPVQAPQPVQAPKPVQAPQPESQQAAEPVQSDEMYSLDDESRSPEPAQQEAKQDLPEGAEGAETKQDGDTAPKNEEAMDHDGEKVKDKKDEPRELTEEEEWAKLNERLVEREKERLERERKQAEEDAKKFEDLKDDPVRLGRLKRKHEKKARWSNYYRSIELTQEVLTPPTEEDFQKVTKEKKESTEIKITEPETLEDDKITLSWYDSDLNQYLELPSLASVVPLSDSAFAHAWAGARASHGVNRGRVCFEVRVGAVVATNEAVAPTNPEKETTLASGLRIGWSTDDASLHLGESEHSWAFESSGRALSNAEFKDYGRTLTEKDVVGAYVDLESNPCKISYTLNGEELGVAYEFDKEALGGKPLFPHVATKNICYRVNFGYDRYNMLTRTKIVRQRLEIPIEEVLEEKRKREEELQRLKEEKQRKEKERREKDKKEREERMRKKREEREKADRERKEKEAQERRERGEPEPEETKEGEAKEEAKEGGDTAEKVEPQENGEKQPEAKAEEMETDAEKPAEEAKVEEVKEEPDADSKVPEVTEEQVLKKGFVLDKRIKFVTRYTVDEELDGSEACLVPGYILIAHADLVDGPRRPATLAECEVILMVGMPGAGKTHWARSHAAANPDKRYNILSTGALFDRMKVDCKPFRASYEGRWDAMVSKCAKCVLKLLEVAKGRRRNFILDQTNVYPSAQRRKLREFDGYRRVAVVVVCDEETYLERQKKREEADGKEVPDGAVMDMKANFTLPEVGNWLDEVRFPELSEEECKKVLEGYHKEARAAGVQREKEKRDRSEGRDQPPHKRARDDDRRRRDDKRSRDRGDREDRWGGGGGGGGGRWGPAGSGGGGGGGGGGRGGSRWSRDRQPQQQGGRFDRWGGGNGGGGGPRNDYGGSRDRDGFRGGRGGGPGRGDRPQGPPGRGPQGPQGPQGPPGDRNRFGNDRGNNRGPPSNNNDKRPGGPPGAGGWQRGGQMATNNRGAMQPRGQGGPPNRNQKDGPNQQNSQQQGWNQWAGGWGGWGNWNQNQAGWGNWGNWGQWPGQQPAAAAAGGQGGQQAGAGGKGAAAGAGAGAGAGAANQQQWPANYTAQQWYQWQQWQQQQQGWPGYGQGGQQGGNSADAQAWAQYYQNYNAAAAQAGQQPGQDKK